MKQPPFDPVYRHARREALFILALFSVLLVWALSVYYFDGYDPQFANHRVATVFGLPRWVFWGIVAPWCVSIGCTIGFVFFFMQDDDLGESTDDEPSTNSEAA